MIFLFIEIPFKLELNDNEPDFYKIEKIFELSTRGIKIKKSTLECYFGIKEGVQVHITK